MAKISHATAVAREKETMQDVRVLLEQAKARIDQARDEGLFANGLPPALHTVNMVVPHYLTQVPAAEG